MLDFVNRMVNHWRRVEGIETFTVKQHQLSSAGKAAVREIGNTRNIHRVGAAGLAMSLYPHQTPQGHVWQFMGGYASLYSIWHAPSLRNHFAQLADLHVDNELFHEKHAAGLQTQLADFKPTHVGVDGQGNLVFIRQPEARGWFQRLLSSQPFKSVRGRLRPEENETNVESLDSRRKKTA